MADREVPAAGWGLTTAALYDRSHRHPALRGRFVAFDAGGSVGDYRCVYVNVEPAQTAREDVAEAMRAIIGATVDQAAGTLP